jgi:hypothetical protein
MLRVSGGWLMLSRSAARRKCSSSATVTKQRSCRKLMESMFFIMSARNIGEEPKGCPLG